MFNVLMGERYKVATKETKDVLLGKYGQTVKPFNPEIVDKVLGEEKKNAITCRPADLLEPELDKIEAEMKPVSYTHLKTGFTGTAGYCYVGALQREDKTLIVALLACGWPNNKTYKWSDTRKLMNYGLEQFKKIDLLQIEPCLLYTSRCV